jgi:YgiT-type zinc finger domain-containing protein
MICNVCGQEGVRIRQMTRSYGKGETLLIIENVPVVSCSHCGTSYLTAQILHEIDRIKRYRHELATQRSVAVAEYT